MFTVIGFMISGLLLGYLLRNRLFIKYLPKFISLAIFILLFLLGISVGANKSIIENMTTLGGEAFLIAGAGVLGSICCAWVVGYYVFKDKGVKKDER